jgi:hypothetical protein
MVTDIAGVGPHDIERASLAPPANVERTLRVAIIKGVLVAVPLTIVLFMGMIALAVGDHDPDWGAWLGMAAVVGIYGGMFFGTMAGFLRTAPLFEDRHSRDRSTHTTSARGRPTPS